MGSASKKSDLTTFFKIPSPHVTHRFPGRLKVQEHLAQQDAPTLFRVPVLYLRDPALHRRLLVVPAEQQLGGVPPLHVLQHPDPVVHGGVRVGRQVVHLLAGVDLERGRALGPVYPAGLVQRDRPLGLPVHVVLALPVRELAVFQHEPPLAPRFQLAAELGQVTDLERKSSRLTQQAMNLKCQLLPVRLNDEFVYVF